jgi:OOP family OmpA-OmpF porin
MKRITATFFALAALLCSGIAAASEERLIAYGGLLYDYMQPDGDRLAEQGQGGRLVLGMPIADYITVEFNALYSTADINIAGTPSDKMSSVGLDLVLSPWRGPIVPYMLAGGGGVRDDVDGLDAENSGYLNIGVGFWARIVGGLFVRGEARRVSVLDGGPVESGANTLVDSHFGLGLQYMFLHDEPPVRPAPVVAPPPPPPRRGPIDSDGDGVPDGQDKCPDTPRGFKVDRNGCIEEKQTVVMLNTVLFNLNSSTLMPASAGILDEVAQGLASQPSVRVEIGGHTCSIGTESYNLALSKRRANSVRQYLIGKGIDPARMTAEGYGEFSPLVSNDTDAGRQQNRRVEFKILSK